MKSLAFLVAAGLALLSAPALAQSPPIDDVEATVVQELVVRARLPGPAWWKVSDADSTVYVLGMPDALPKGLAWDQSVLARRLQGADRVITPPVVQVGAGVRDVPALYGLYRRANNTGRRLDAALPPALNARFGAAALRAGKGADEYQTMLPWLAGVRLADAFRERVGLDDEEPLKAVRRAAKRAKVKTEPALVLKDRAVPLARALSALPDTVGVACLEDAVEAVEGGDGALRRAAAGWAVGDVATALTSPRTGDRCLAAIPGAGALKREALAKQASAIEAALGRRGHTVAVLSLRSLVAQGGVLDQLRSRGHAVQTPE